MSVALLSLGLLAAGKVTAASEGGPRWSCWYAPTNVAIRCLLAAAPWRASLERVMAADAAADPRLPGLVKTIWGRPQVLVGQPISIPLWTEPTDFDLAVVLAQSVMCAIGGPCQVDFDRNEDGLAETRAVSGALEAEAYERAELAPAGDRRHAAATQFNGD